jgi:hypothetical protein
MGLSKLRPSSRVAGQGIAAESPHGESGALAAAGIFNDNGAGLLIVPALFFIQRRNGEVAEWSKALPC